MFIFVLLDVGAWSARNADYSQYLEIDFGADKNISALATQGRQDSQEYVTAYTLSTSQDGILFTQLKGPDGSIWVSVRRSLTGNFMILTFWCTRLQTRFVDVLL